MTKLTPNRDGNNSNTRNKKTRNQYLKAIYTLVNRTKLEYCFYYLPSRKNLFYRYPKSLSNEAFTEVELNLDKPKKVWVTILEVEISQLKEIRIVAIVMNANTFSESTDIDYFITNVNPNLVTPEWIVETYSQRNWVEVFYREAKGWLGLKEYQVRHKRSLLRHFILVFCAYTFILWHKLTGGLQRRWSNRSLNTFPEALEAFRTAISYRFYKWLQDNANVFAMYKASLGYIWA